tara:strand:+ start:244 stop:1398 length:1155 start_codon:yes stop_codon:yes gene_type:complete
MFRLPKKLETKEINFLYKVIRERTEGFSSDRWIRFLQYFYDADLNIDSFNENEFQLIKNSAIDSHYQFFHFEEILNFKSFQKNPLSKKFLELKNQFPLDYDSSFFDWLWGGILEQSCLNKKIKLNSDNNNIINTFTPQILKNIHNLICNSDLNTLSLVSDIELNTKFLIKSEDFMKDISKKYYPFLLMYFDTISLYAHLVSHLDIFKKHHKLLQKQAEKVNDEYFSNPDYESESIRDFLYDIRSEFFDTFLGFGDDQEIFKQEENYIKYKEDLKKALDTIENFTKTCIVFEVFANEMDDYDLNKYKISIDDQSNFVANVDENLFSKLNTLNPDNINEFINYDYDKNLNFKSVNKLIKEYETILDICIGNYDKYTPHAIYTACNK